MPNQTSCNSAYALEHGSNYTSSNTVVKDGSMWIFGNKIAFKTTSGAIYITNCGWTSRTTFDRLNAISGVWVRSIRGMLILNGERWDGEWIKI